MADEKVLITESTLDEIADAIREKNGETFKYYPREMPSAVRRIPTGTGGGSVVAVFPVLLSGTHIADIVVDGDTFELYAPTPKTYTQGTGIEISQNGVVSVSEALRNTINDKVDNDTFTTAINNLVASVASKQDLLTAGQNITIQGNVISATGGGASAVSDLTDVNLNDLADGQVLKWNATSQKWENANESGGTTVIANPTGTPTDQLNTIQIGEDIYEIVGGGSGGNSLELICEQATIQSTQTLTHSIDDYDAILMNVEAFDSNTGYQCTSLTVLENIAVGKNIGVSSESGVIWFTVQSMSSLSLGYYSGNWRNLEIYGVKFGSSGGSGGSSSELIEFGAGDGTTSRTFQLSKTPSMVVMSYFEGNDDSGWSSQYVLIWGSARAYGTGTGTPTSTSGESKTVGVTYGADGKSFTINAANAGSALNTNTGHGYLLCFYNAGGSGGSGYEETELYTASARAATMNLSDSIENYDAIEVEVSWLYNSVPYHISSVISSEVLSSAYNILYTIGTSIYRYQTFKPTDATTFVYMESDNDTYISKIKGLKYGSGGGGGGSSLPFDVVIDSNDNGINLIYEYDDGQ